MKVGIHVICRPDAALGIGLAGLAPIIAGDGAAAADALAALAGEPGHGGLVLIEQPLHDALPAAVHRQLRRDGLPIIMPFPGPSPLAEGRTPEHDLLEILRRAIGYRVRLR